MALRNDRNTDVKFVTVLADGQFHLEVPEGTEGAKVREYETSDKKVGKKIELTFDTLEGMITSLTFKEGEYGNQLYLGIDDVVVCMGVASSYAEDVMKKVPNIDFEKPVTLKPYALETEAGKTKKGITIMQDGEKIKGYFYDAEKKENLHGMPNPKDDTSKYTKERWIRYFMDVREFLVEYLTANHLKELDVHVAPVPKYDSDEAERIAATIAF